MGMKKISSKDGVKWKKVKRNNKYYVYVYYDDGDKKILPFYEKFFLGGERSIRGFDIYRIGPKDPEGYIIGGNKAFFMNFEYHIPLSEQFSFVFFYDLGNAYDLVAQITPLITKHHGKDRINGVLVDKENQWTKLTFDKYEFTVKHSHTLGWENESRDEYWVPGGAIIIRTGDKEFFVAGSGITITFKKLDEPDTRVGILKTDEGEFINNNWKVIRHLNGDQTHQGRHIRIFRNNFSIQRFELYEYK